MSDRVRPRIAIDDENGRPVAAADIEAVGPDVVRASLHVEPGHLPRDARERLVDAVLDDPEVKSRQQLEVSLPLGDTEILDRVRERCDSADSRAAGASCLVDADLPRPEPAEG